MKDVKQITYNIDETIIEKFDIAYKALSGD